MSDPGRTHLRPAEAPSAQIGPASDLEMVTPEVTGYTASQNVVALDPIMVPVTRDQLQVLASPDLSGRSLRRPQIGPPGI